MRMRNNLYSFCVTAEVKQDSQELNNGQWYSKRSDFQLCGRIKMLVQSQRIDEMKVFGEL